MARGRRAFAILAFVSTTLTACGAPDIPAAPAGDEQLVLGRQVWANQCVSCHGASGGGGRGKKLNGGALMNDLPNEADQVTLVTDGKGQMPAFGARLSDAEIQAVVRYTREIINDQG